MVDMALLAGLVQEGGKGGGAMVAPWQSYHLREKNYQDLCPEPEELDK